MTRDRLNFNTLNNNFPEQKTFLGDARNLNLIEDESIDLLILSHVMEHFTNPIEEMIEVIKKVTINKYLLIEVPGIFYMDKVYLYPILIDW